MSIVDAAETDSVAMSFDKGPDVVAATLSQRHAWRGLHTMHSRGKFV